MKFIIPQNYDFSSKLFGFIDYSTAFVNVIWYIVVFCLINLFNITLFFKIFLFIIFCFPVFLFTIIGFNQENILYVIIYVLKYAFGQKVYLYR